MLKITTSHKPLLYVSVLMLATLAASLVGLAVDPRIITGMPAWLKPAKFGASTGIYGFTLLWIFTYIPEWRRTRRVVGWITAVVFVLEIAIIDAQAWRGSTSHFNVGTPRDAVLFGVMGTAIMIQTLSTIWVAVALWRQRFADETLGWALRLGVAMTIVGAAIGGMMTRPTAAQLADARATRHMPFAGAHTVGAPDGGPGLRGTGWSVEHGDLRVAHFVGLHAVQALALFALALRRRRDALDTATALNTVRLVKIAAASYFALFVILEWQALRAEPLVHPTTSTAVALALWAAVTAVAAGVSMLRHTPRPSAAIVA